MQARNHENSDEIRPTPVRHLDLATPAFYTYRKNPKCYHTVWGKFNLGVVLLVLNCLYRKAFKSDIAMGILSKTSSLCVHGGTRSASASAHSWSRGTRKPCRSTTTGGLRRSIWCFWWLHEHCRAQRRKLVGFVSTACCHSRFQWIDCWAMGRMFGLGRGI